MRRRQFLQAQFLQAQFLQAQFLQAVPRDLAGRPERHLPHQAELARLLMAGQGRGARHTQRGLELARHGSVATT